MFKDPSSVLKPLPRESKSQSYGTSPYQTDYYSPNNDQRKYKHHKKHRSHDKQQQQQMKSLRTSPENLTDEDFDTESAPGRASTKILKGLEGSEKKVSSLKNAIASWLQLLTSV